jgi:ketosteroid isomerase-like protein
MQRRTLLFGISSVIAGGPWLQATAPQQTSAKSKADQVADSERAFADALARRDPAAFASHLSNEAVFFGEGDPPIVLRGKAAVVEGWKKFFDAPSPPFSWAPDLVEVLESGTLALSTGPVRDPSGTVFGRFNSIWRLESDGRWRVVFDKGCPVCR